MATNKKKMVTRKFISLSSTLLQKKSKSTLLQNSAVDLIPALPDDVARLCLLRAHYTQLSSMSSVSPAWQSELRSPEFLRFRKQLSTGNELILLQLFTGKVYKLILLELKTRIWSELHVSIPEFRNGVPENFNFVVASFKWGFVVVGAYRRPHKRLFCNKVFLYDYISGTWKPGADMLEGRHHVYRSTSDRDRMIYVLCEQDLFIKLIMVYDVARDEWIRRVQTGEHGGYCEFGSMRTMIYDSGKIHFFDKRLHGLLNNDDKRTLNVSTWEWESPAHHFLDRGTSGVCLTDDGEWYSYRNKNGTLLMYKDFKWKVIGKVDRTKKRSEYITAWKDKVLIFEGRNGLKGRMFDLKTRELTTLTAPKNLSGLVRDGCYLEI